MVWEGRGQAKATLIGPIWSRIIFGGRLPRRNRQREQKGLVTRSQGKFTSFFTVAKHCLPHHAYTSWCAEPTPQFFSFRSFDFFQNCPSLAISKSKNIIDYSSSHEFKQPQASTSYSAPALRHSSSHWVFSLAPLNLIPFHTSTDNSRIFTFIIPFFHRSMEANGCTIFLQFPWACMDIHDLFSFLSSMHIHLYCWISMVRMIFVCSLFAPEQGMELRQHGAKN